MPELPDVEVFKQYLESTILSRRIADVSVRDHTVLANTTQPALNRKLRGKACASVQRHGKHLFLHTSNAAILGLHFGMTGRPICYRKSEKEPEHARALFIMDDGYRLAFVCQRLLGRIHLLKNAAAFLRAHDIGPDALNMEQDDFVNLAPNCRSGLKSLLMNQGHLAGIGNVYADEILFRARLCPQRKASRLAVVQAKQLYRALQYVLKQAIDRKADRKRYPRTWLTPHRRKDSPACPRGCGPLKRTKVNGRTTWWCAKCQE